MIAIGEAVEAAGQLVAAGPMGVGSNAGEAFVFWVCATLAVLGALGMVLSRKAVHSALSIAMTMISLAVLYIAQDAVFLGMVQIIVYTGAVMMLFIFVLMVVGVDSSDSTVETIRGQRVIAVLAFLGVAGLLISGLLHALDGTAVIGLESANSTYGGNVHGIAALIFGRYLFAFEVTSALLITAAVGAMVLTHRERLVPRKSQRQLSDERFLASAHPGNTPNPGVYARNNAADMPALLPDGSIAPESVPVALRLAGASNPADRAALSEASRLESHQPALLADADAPVDPQRREGER